MVVIGLTGNIGTGKSTVSAMLAELGAKVIDADKLGHEILKAGSPAWRELVAVFGRGILRPDNEVDRQKLASLVFGNPDSLRRLDEITHPRIFQAVKDRLEEWRKQGVKVAVIEAPLLLEADWTTSVVDQIWVTVAPEAIIVQRLREQKGIPRESVLARLRSQLPPEDKIGRADVVIDTSGDLKHLRARVTELWRQLNADDAV